MKRILLFLTLLALANLVYAQAPKGFSYQAIASRKSGNPVVNNNVSVRISILDGSSEGGVLYMETHSVLTNENGLFNLIIGEGHAESGNFDVINWGINPRFIKVDIDPDGGYDYATMGINKLMSVPYALFAESAGYLKTGENNDRVSNNSVTGFGSSGCAVWNGNSLIIGVNKYYTLSNVLYSTPGGIILDSSGNAYAVSSSLVLMTQPINGTPIVSLSKNNWLVTSTHLYVFANDLWSVYLISGIPYVLGENQGYPNKTLVTTTGIYYFDSITQNFSFEGF